MSRPTSPLEAAARIGRSLCRGACWDRAGRHCNWMGRSTAEVARAGDPVTPTSAALGPDLYAGSAGVALFLAELAALTGDPDCRRTALGAIDRSIRQLDRTPPAPGPDSPLSFFNGPLGVAYAARRIGVLTGHPGLDAQAETLLDRLAEAAAAPHLMDVIGGNAGAIPALLAMGPRRLDLATALGEELCRAAHRRGPAWGWEAGATSGLEGATASLTGLAHGTAGIGLALMELHAATGRELFLEGALGAFAAEDSQFDPARGNWPDLRYADGPDAATRPPRFATGWCHGAPGIALGRLRAGVLDAPRRDAHHATARAALATTLAAIEAARASPRADPSLCHGLAGLGEIVLIAWQVLGDDEYRRGADGVGRLLIDRHSAAGDWPSGLTSGGPNPSLMLGTAGVGHAFLRLHDPEGVPPILIRI